MSDHGPRVNLRRSFLIIALVVVLIGVAGSILKPEVVSGMLEAIKNADHPLLGLAVATYFFSVVLWTLRWRIALSSIGSAGPSVRFAILLPIIFSAIFLNNITPFARAGGDPFGRVYLIRRRANVKYSTAIAASLGEHFFDPLLLASFLVAGLILHLGQDSVRLTTLLLVIGALVIFGMVVLPRLILKRMVGVRLISTILTRVAGRLGSRLAIQRMVEGIEDFYSSTYAVIDGRRAWSAIAGLTALMWALDLLRVYIIFLALGQHPGIAMLLLASSIPTVAGMISFLPGGLVIVEGSLISVFVLFGYALDISTAAALIERSISFVLSSAIGGAIFAYLGVTMASDRPEPETEHKCA